MDVKMKRVMFFIAMLMLCLPAVQSSDDRGNADYVGSMGEHGHQGTGWKKSQGRIDGFLRIKNDTVVIEIGKKGDELFFPVDLPIETAKKWENKFVSLRGVEKSKKISVKSIKEIAPPLRGIMNANHTWGMPVFLKGGTGDKMEILNVRYHSYWLSAQAFQWDDFIVDSAKVKRIYLISAKEYYDQPAATCLAFIFEDGGFVSHSDKSESGFVLGIYGWKNKNMEKAKMIWELITYDNFISELFGLSVPEHVSGYLYPGNRPKREAFLRPLKLNQTQMKKLLHLALKKAAASHDEDYFCPGKNSEKSNILDLVTQAVSSKSGKRSIFDSFKQLNVEMFLSAKGLLGDEFIVNHKNGWMNPIKVEKRAMQRE